jgi:ribosomal protein L12E/L44/L45/RPP1/RPP2
VCVVQDEFVTSMAAIALYDGEAEITANNINTLLAASNNAVAPYWPGLFASMLKDGRCEKLVFSVGAPSAAPAAAAGVGKFMFICSFIRFNCVNHVPNALSLFDFVYSAAAAGDAPAAPAAEKKKEEVVDALDGGMDMFGGGGGGGGDY